MANSVWEYLHFSCMLFHLGLTVVGIAATFYAKPAYPAALVVSISLDTSKVESSEPIYFRVFSMGIDILRIFVTGFPWPHDKFFNHSMLARSNKGKCAIFQPKDVIDCEHDTPDSHDSVEHCSRKRCCG